MRRETPDGVMFHSRKSASYIFVCSASFGRLMSVFFHVAGLILVTMPCCRAALPGIGVELSKERKVEEAKMIQVQRRAA